MKTVWRDRTLLVVVASAVTARISFWIYTQRVWEDALITLNAARNAVMGNGLTHHVGEGHVYSFTSALSVLVPLVGEFAWHGSGLFILRVTALAASVVALAYAYLLCGRLGVGRWPTLFVLAFLALDRLQIFYGMAGMETQLAVAVLLASAYYVHRGSGLGSGLGLGLCVLARPDFVLWAGPAWLWLLLRDRLAAAKAAMVGALITGPWLIFTQLYYGTVVPQPIRAKYGSFVDVPGLTHPVELASWIVGRLHIHSNLWQLFTPLYTQNVPRPVLAVMAPVATGAISLALIGAWSMIRTGLWPLPAYWAIFLGYRVFFLLPYYYEWYVAPFAAVDAILIGVGLTVIARRWPRPVPALAVLLAAVFAAHIPASFSLDQRRQQVEQHVRVPLGRYLGTVVQPGQAVGTESAGYVGYYSQAKLYDYPGLTSRASFETLKSAPTNERTLEYVVAKLLPEWVVFRPFELDDFAANYPEARARYRIVSSFSYGDNRFLGMSISATDSSFIVLKRV